MNWASKRRVVVIAILIIVIFSFVTMLALVFTTKTSTCFDGEQNGVETGIDCGGGCMLVCENEARPLSVLFAQYLETDGRPDVIAHVANLNKSIDAISVQYTVEVFTEDGDMFAQHTGFTNIPHESTRAIFIPQVASSAPKGGRAFITIKDQTFLKAGNGPKLFAESFAWEDLATAPTLIVKIRGDENVNLRRIPFTVIIFDAQNTVLAASNTVIDSIEVDEKQEIVFTWNKSFSREVVRVDFVFDTPRTYGER
jgi:hypothetical protein